MIWIPANLFVVRALVAGSFIGKVTIRHLTTDWAYLMLNVIRTKKKKKSCFLGRKFFFWFFPFYNYAAEEIQVLRFFFLKKSYYSISSSLCGLCVYNSFSSIAFVHASIHPCTLYNACISSSLCCFVHIACTHLGAGGTTDLPFSQCCYKPPKGNQHG
jgi:hypothetical protein